MLIVLDFFQEYHENDVNILIDLTLIWTQDTGAHCWTFLTNWEYLTTLNLESVQKLLQITLLL